MSKVGLVCLLVCCLLTSFPARAAEFGDIDLGIYALGSWPQDRQIFNQGSTVEASIKQGFGAGIKIALFPNFLHRMLGLELESNGHSSALSFPNGNNGTARSNMLILNSMVNLIARYPGELVRPYIGIGAGWSSSALLDPNIAGRKDNDFDTAHALAYQYIGGLQFILTQRVFAFSEYRYFSANYHWDGLAVDFRSHYGLVGVGLRF
ncbi:MAG TPA: outer membrane beta-barrel protein [Nitrospira sp.]|nr:outer membrane beta-barrel protein [Nitrospira sp.]